MTFKELAPYLPYGLKIYVPNSGTATLSQIASDGYNDFRIGVQERLGLYYLKDWDAKPILRPLSDLNKQAPQTVSGIRNVDQINSKSSYSLKHKDGETFFWDLPEEMSISWIWGTFEQLFANHYDVFGLIERGEAIDINTLQQ